MSLNRFLLLTMLLVALVIAGCGGDDNGGDGGGDDDEGTAPATIAEDDPTNVIPAGAPIVLSVSTDLDSDEVQSVFTFAERLDPSDRDLEAELRKELASDDVSFEDDIEPWLGDEGVLALDELQGEDATGVFAVATTDEEAAQAALDKAGKGEERDYKGITYSVDEDGEASGIVEGFVVGASDEEHFQQAVDAAQGSSLADDSKYRDALGRVADDGVASAYFSVDGIIELAKQSGEVPPGTFDQLEQVPGYEPGATAVASLVAEDDKMTLEASSSAPGAESGDGPDLADLAGDAWAAFAAPIQGEQIAQGFRQGAAAAGEPQAEQLLESLGVADYLQNLQDISFRIGGEDVTSINGELRLGGTDEAAAKDLLDKVKPFVQQGASANGIQVQEDGDGLSAQFGPYAFSLTADGGDMTFRVGDEPDGTLGDSEGFQAAEDELDIDGGRIVAFVDFAPLLTFIESVPGQDADIAEARPVLEQLGLLAVGYGEEDGGSTAKAVLTLR